MALLPFSAIDASVTTPPLLWTTTCCVLESKRKNLVMLAFLSIAKANTQLNTVYTCLWTSVVSRGTFTAPCSIQVMLAVPEKSQKLNEIQPFWLCVTAHLPTNLMCLKLVLPFSNLQLRLTGSVSKMLGRTNPTY